jgi:hypothetical protein
LVLGLLFFVHPDFIYSSNELELLKKEMEALREDQKEIQKDLQQIKSILRARGLLEEDPQNLFIDISGRPFKGNKNARLVLIEFSEYQ